MIGAIVLSPTDAASQEIVVGSAQRVVMARARAPGDAAVQHCLETAGSEHSGFELEGSARSVVRFERVPQEAAPSVTYAPIDLDGQVGNVVNVPLSSRYTNLFVWLYTWPAVSTLYVAMDSSIPFVRKHMISVWVSDTVSPNAAHTTTITPIIFLGC